MNYDFKGERINPFFTNDVTFANHIMRYEFARNVLSQKGGGLQSVLDLACGAGYGTRYLSENLSSIKYHGRDISPESIDFANENYSRDNCTFRIEDLRDLSTDELFDAIISFETLEHIDFVESYFDGICRRLADGGTFVLSVPDKRSNIDAGYKNEFHPNEMYIEDLIFYLERYFSEFKIYVQKQRKISELRRVVGKMLSKYTPRIKNYILRGRNQLTKTHNFTGHNFSEFFSSKQSLLNDFKVLQLDEVDYQKDRICYVVVASK